MALFGCSPLFLSVIATNFFTDPATGQLDICHFMRFLALLTGSVCILGFINLRGLKHSVHQPQIIPEAIEENVPQETSPLLVTTLSNHQLMQASDPSTIELLYRFDFWLLIFFCLLTLGAVRIFSSILDFCS